MNFVSLTRRLCGRERERERDEPAALNPELRACSPSQQKEKEGKYTPEIYGDVRALRIIPWWVPAVLYSGGYTKFLRLTSFALLMD